MSALSRLSRHLFHRRTLLARPFSTAPPTPPPKSIDDVNNLFAEARLCLQDALESRGTVYFTDDFADAKQATEATLSAFNTLIDASTPETRASLLAANRPKMAQLEEEFRQLEHELIHDE